MNFSFSRKVHSKLFSPPLPPRVLYDGGNRSRSLWANVRVTPRKSGRNVGHARSRKTIREEGKRAREQARGTMSKSSAIAERERE